MKLKSLLVPVLGLMLSSFAYSALAEPLQTNYSPFMTLQLDLHYDIGEPIVMPVTTDHEQPAVYFANRSIEVKKSIINKAESFNLVIFRSSEVAAAGRYGKTV